MIFSRRSVQKRLDELRQDLSKDKVDKLVTRLNTPGKDSLAAMWEVVILQSLNKLGEVSHEEPVATGRKPDLVFKNNEIEFTADITTISDDGLDELSPQKKLNDELTLMRKRLGIELRGMDLNIGSKSEQKRNGSKVTLKLPKRSQIRNFVIQKIEPEIKMQIGDGKDILNYCINTDQVDIKLKIDTASSQYDSCNHAVYDSPTIIDSNPLYNALKGKKDQLRQIEGITGVIVCDGDSNTLSERIGGWGVTTNEILRKYLRLNTSIDFVLLLTIREKDAFPSSRHDVTRTVYVEVLTQESLSASDDLKHVLRSMLNNLPKPIMMPVNAAMRASEGKYPLGFQGGGFQRSGNKYRFSLREFMEILSDSSVPRNGKYYSRDHIRTYFKKWLEDGCLPKGISIQEATEDDSDSWIEIEIEGPDPAISPFR